MVSIFELLVQNIAATQNFSIRIRLVNFPSGRSFDIETIDALDAVSESCPPVDKPKNFWMFPLEGA